MMAVDPGSAESGDCGGRLTGKKRGGGAAQRCSYTVPYLEEGERTLPERLNE